MNESRTNLEMLWHPICNWLYYLQGTPDQSWWLYIYIEYVTHVYVEFVTHMYVKFVTHSYVWCTRDSRSELATLHICEPCQTLHMCESCHTLHDSHTRRVWHDSLFPYTLYMCESRHTVRDSWVMSHCSWLTHTKSMTWLTLPSHSWYVWLKHSKSVREEWVNSLFPHALDMWESWRVWSRVRDSFSSLTLLCVWVMKSLK